MRAKVGRLPKYVPGKFWRISDQHSPFSKVAEPLDQQGFRSSGGPFSDFSYDHDPLPPPVPVTVETEPAWKEPNRLWLLS